MINHFNKTIPELHKKNIETLHDAETRLKSKLTKSETQIEDLKSAKSELTKLRSEFETLTKNHLRTTEELNR